jgi:predicted ATP-dependent endonuclease of OLD family
MKYISFEIENYRAIKSPLKISVSKNTLIPIIGINECGKTTILQAIFSFDWNNDHLYGGRHLDDLSNLYERSNETDNLVRATLQIKKSKLEEIRETLIEWWEDIKDQIDRGEIEEGDDYYLESLDDNLIEEWTKLELSFKNDFITIERNLRLKDDYCYHIKEIPNNSIFDDYFHHYFASEIISNAPKIIYNDDFMDRPPSQVNLGAKETNEWFNIYNQCFLDCHGQGSILDLLRIEDKRRVDSTLAEMQDLINRKLGKAWKSFSLANHNSLEVRLSIQKSALDSGMLEISIVERVDKLEKHFYVSDRSKGFLWFFNFVMKLEFNPKVNGEKKNTIYLLDEPGSYLHFSAQEKLCNKLVEISKSSGVVIYCTHSHTLLDPKKIPLHSIYIVEKDKHKRVSAKPLNQMTTKIESSSAFQPLHEALELSAFDFKISIGTALCVEGIYDKYAIELFCPIESFNIFPSTGGDSIIKNIQYFIGYRIDYIALWDNDDAGRGFFEKATEIFGDEESKRFMLLPDLGRKNVRMEEMFAAETIQSLANLLGLDKSTSYEKVMMTAYYSEKTLQKKLIASIDEDTSKNFKRLADMINKIKNNIAY